MNLVPSALLTFVLSTFALSPALSLSAQSPSPAAAAPSSVADLKLPLKNNSVRFEVIGDNGTGEPPEFDVAAQMERIRAAAKIDFVIMDGDNIYGGHKPADFVSKFELPYKPLLDAGVKFYATLGNHDDPDIERNYKFYNMGGNRYYSYKKGDVEFFVLDSNYMDPQQLSWIDSKLSGSTAKWKICYFHHPLFTAAKFHGPAVDLRQQLMPLFTKYNVNVVFSGHEHVYEHIRPQSGVNFFVVGNSGELRFHNLRPSDLDLVGFDTDRTFMAVEIEGEHFFYQTFNSHGGTVDSGEIDRSVPSGSAK